MNKPIISIVAVNWHAKDFTELLIDSAIKTTKNEAEIIIIDNSKNLEPDCFGDKYLTQEKRGQILDIIVDQPKENLGHGRGVDLAIKEHAQGKYILALDIDSHLLLKDWDEKLIDVYQRGRGETRDFHNGRLRLIGAEGSLLKPMRPLFMFFERKFFLANGMSFAPRECDGVKFDVGIHFYFKTLSLGKSVEFLKWSKSNFKDVWGEEYTLDGLPVVFHHWYATRWFNAKGEKAHDEIDGRKYEDYLKSKENLFKQINDSKRNSD